MANASKKGLKPPSFGHRGAANRTPTERALPGTSYALPPDPEALAARRKRTAGVSLVLAGVGALGLYSYEKRQQCLEQNPQNPNACRSSSRSSSGSSGRSWYSSSSATPANRVAQTTTTRGGFGSFFRSGGG